MKLLIAAVAVFGFALGAAFAADGQRRDHAVFHHLTQPMYVRAGPAMAADTVQTLAAGSIVRLGRPDENGWAPVGDVIGRRTGYIYAGSERLTAGVPDTPESTALSVDEVVAVNVLAATCGIARPEAALLIERTRTALRRSGHVGLGRSDVERLIAEAVDLSDARLSCHQAAGFLILR